ncbi:hypothetical protein A3Q56_02491 [Intoshia linei]|uniref:Transcriptional coactivator p15 (PC4) C-terminal domain-containing protein n=1 Tax=Intoshia linei TaxID=1819745 RepID=A0A177B7T5_9BILA|nr:hypothetical protein A3Q56_02491 [Intoshia linei]
MNDEKLLRISSKRYISVNEYKGMQLVSIREYYEQDGRLKPSTKGISLTKHQWKMLKEHIYKIDRLLK